MCMYVQVKNLISFPFYQFLENVQKLICIKNNLIRNCIIVLNFCIIENVNFLVNKVFPHCGGQKGHRNDITRIYEISRKASIKFKFRTEHWSCVKQSRKQYKTWSCSTPCDKHPCPIYYSNIISFNENIRHVWFAVENLDGKF